MVCLPMGVLYSTIMTMSTKIFHVRDGHGIKMLIRAGIQGGVDYRQTFDRLLREGRSNSASKTYFRNVMTR